LTVSQNSIDTAHILMNSMQLTYRGHEKWRETDQTRRHTQRVCKAVKEQQHLAWYFHQLEKPFRW